MYDEKFKEVQDSLTPLIGQQGGSNESGPGSEEGETNADDENTYDDSL